MPPSAVGKSEPRSSTDGTDSIFVIFVPDRLELRSYVISVERYQGVRSSYFFYLINQKMLIDLEKGFFIRLPDGNWFPAYVVSFEEKRHQGIRSSKRAWEARKSLKGLQKPKIDFEKALKNHLKCLEKDIFEIFVLYDFFFEVLKYLNFLQNINTN